mgnify:CR=1 FL=1
MQQAAIGVRHVEVPPAAAPLLQEPLHAAIEVRCGCLRHHRCLAREEKDQAAEHQLLVADTDGKLITLVSTKLFVQLDVVEVKGLLNQLIFIFIRCPFGRIDIVIIKVSQNLLRKLSSFCE